MSYKLRFLYAAKAAHPAGAVFATLRLADFCLALTASQTLIRGSLVFSLQQAHYTVQENAPSPTSPNLQQRTVDCLATISELIRYTLVLQKRL